MDNRHTMPLPFVYRKADIYISALQSAEISAVRYTNMNGIVPQNFIYVSSFLNELAKIN